MTVGWLLPLRWPSYPVEGRAAPGNPAAPLLCRLNWDGKEKKWYFVDFFLIEKKVVKCPESFEKLFK